MAEEGEKTEEPTPEKLRKAREQGQVAKSADFISAVIFIGAFSVVSATLSTHAQYMGDLLVEAIQSISRRDLLPVIMAEMSKSMTTWLKISIPVLATAYVLALMGNYFQIGFLFTVEPLKPKLNKLDPIKGIKQLFSKKRLVEVIKQILKFLVIGLIVYYTVKSALPAVVLMQHVQLSVALPIVGTIIKDISIRSSAIFLLIAAADYFYQKHAFKKSMMMSRSEIKTEYKQAEGDPEMKGERKRLAQELIMHGSQQRVKNADAVVSNPAHIAVAIAYDANKKSAPVVIAKGLRLNAQKILEIARQYDVPILRNIPLAQALNKLELDEEIPEELYEAVAEILNFVYELKAKKK